MPSRLLQLPPELQSEILSWVLRLEHLTQVCLVCKQLRVIALPLLYREVSINVYDWTQTHLEHFLLQGHPGHPHIRSIDVDSTHIEDEQDALKVAKDVLHILPRNGLRSFRCPLEEGVDNDLMILLAAQQRRLASICIGPLQENALNIPDVLLPWPPSVDTVTIPWRLLSPRDIAFYHELIQRSGCRLKAITIRVHDFVWHSNKEQACEELARGLFDHPEGDFDRPALQLRDLNFQNQDFDSFYDTWRHYIDFSRLRTLQIWNCSHSDELLESLIELAASQPLQLQGLVLSAEESGHAPLFAGAILRSFSGLRYLNLCFNLHRGGGTPHRRRFRVRYLEGHAATLQDLYIGIGTNCPGVDRQDIPVFTPSDLWTPTLEDLQWFASRCHKLRQLAIAMPMLQMNKAVAGKWGRYLEHLTILATMPQLKTLRLLTWPSYWDRKQDGSRGRTIKPPQHRTYYLSQLDIVADSIARLFARLRDEHQCRLSVITFGNAGPYDGAQAFVRHPMPMYEPVTYKIRRVESEFGWLLETERVDPAEMKHEEPIAYVFDEDTDQGLSLESYPWGNLSR